MATTVHPYLQQPSLLDCCCVESFLRSGACSVDSELSRERRREGVIYRRAAASVDNAFGGSVIWDKVGDRHGVFTFRGTNWGPERAATLERRGLSTRLHAGRSAVTSRSEKLHAQGGVLPGFGKNVSGESFPMCRAAILFSEEATRRNLRLSGVGSLQRVGICGSLHAGGGSIQCKAAERAAMEGETEKLGSVDVEKETELREPLVQEEGLSNLDWSAVVLPFLFPAIGGLLFGYDIGATSGAAVSIVSPELSGTDWYSLSSLQTGLVVSGSLYGALGGSILAFIIADFLGRRKELMTAALLYILGALITGFAPNLEILVAGRVIFGLGIGLSMHAAPMYIAETSPTQIRGTLISLKEALIVGGILLGYLVGDNQVDAVGGWRVMFGFAAPIAALMGIGMWSLPPSPRWLLLRAVQGQGEEGVLKQKAANALQRLRGSTCTQDFAEEEAEQTWVALKATCEGEDVNVSLGELFQGVNLKALLVGGGLVFFQQFTGQPSVLYYAAPILQSAGFSAASDATKLAVLLGFFKLIMTAFAVLNVDKLGRRPLLLGGVAGITVSLATLAAYFSFLESYPYLAVASLLLYVGCYQISFGPISWLMVSEIFPLRTRGRALSVTTLVNFGSNAVVALAFAPLQDLVGESYTFVIFGIISVISLIFIFSSVPETKGLSLEQIEAKLQSK